MTQMHLVRNTTCKHNNLFIIKPKKKDKRTRENGRRKTNRERELQGYNKITGFANDNQRRYYTERSDISYTDKEKLF